MRIELRLYASLSRYMPVQGSGGQPEMAEVAEGTTIRELLEGLGVPLGAIKVIFLNGIHAKGEAVLKEGDRVGVFPPVAGG
ncbi:MAG: MoaD/ThiS family protein [Deltaproteobacteria bacterium]|nr:MoaD/ThiS family protein [Deltaproteobacteria bacterium]